MSYYEGPTNNLRPRYAQPSLPMGDMPYKPGKSPEEIAEAARLEREEEAKKKARREATAAKRKASTSTTTKRPLTARETTEARRRKPGVAKTSRAQSSQVTASRPKKQLPQMRTPGEQPRDNLGRFASKAGAALWGATKATARGTGRAIKATHKTVKSAHKAIKRSNAAARRRADLEHKERALALRERAAKLKVKSRKRSGKAKGKPRKQGFISRLLFGKRRKR